MYFSYRRCYDMPMIFLVWNRQEWFLYILPGPGPRLLVTVVLVFRFCVRFLPYPRIYRPIFRNEILHGYLLGWNLA